jgi:hypothetical protein
MFCTSRVLHARLSSCVTLHLRLVLLLLPHVQDDRVTAKSVDIIFSNVIVKSNAAKPRRGAAVKRYGSLALLCWCPGD